MFSNVTRAEPARDPANREVTPSDDESDAGYDSDAFEFADPVEEVRAQRRREKAPAYSMSEAEALVYALVTSEGDLAKRQRVEQDAVFAQQLEVEEVRSSMKEAAERHRRQFRRRWQCSVFLYDNKKLRDFVLMYDMPFFCKEGAPMPWKDRLDRFKATRRHEYAVEKNNADLAKRWGTAYGMYSIFREEFKKHKVYNWSQQDERCDLLSAQYLMTHVHLYFVQDRGNPRRLCEVVEYVYGDDVSGNRTRMLEEAAEWLGVLVQLAMKHGIHYALDREAVTMILRCLLDDEAPSPYEMIKEIARVKSFVPVTGRALGLANPNVYYKSEELVFANADEQ